MPPGFKSLIAGYAPKVFFPLSTTPVVNPAMDQPYDIRSAWLTLTGRLKPGINRVAAEAGINPLWHSIRAGEMSQLGNQERLNRLGFLRDSKLLLLDDSRGFSPLRDQIQVALLILMGMVGLVQFPKPGFLQFYVRTWQSPEGAEADIRNAMHQVDSKLVVDGLRTMDEQIAHSTSNDQLITSLAVAFGLLATMMGAIGLYGVLAYSTAQRTTEIGIRMALGADRNHVVRLVLSDVLWLTFVSLAVAVPCSLLLSHFLRSQLFDVSPANPLVIPSAVLLVALVVAIAAALPARRAASIEPMQALRAE